MNSGAGQAGCGDVGEMDSDQELLPTKVWHGRAGAAHKIIGPGGKLTAMALAPIRLGTSSWTGEGWLGSFYPAGSKPQDFLPLYAERFDTVEVDSTFYRIPAASAVRQWRERTPAGFTFAAKLPQTITHEKLLVGVEEDLVAFLKVMDLLEPPGWRS